MTKSVNLGQHRNLTKGNFKITSSLSSVTGNNVWKKSYMNTI